MQPGPGPQQVWLTLGKPGDLASSLIPATISRYLDIQFTDTPRPRYTPSWGAGGEAHPFCSLLTPQVSQVLHHQSGSTISTKHKLGMNNTSCVKTGKAVSLIWDVQASPVKWEGRTESAGFKLLFRGTLCSKEITPRAPSYETEQVRAVWWKQAGQPESLPSIYPRLPPNCHPT